MAPTSNNSPSEVQPRHLPGVVATICVGWYAYLKKVRWLRPRAAYLGADNLHMNTAAQLARVRALCLELPGTSERLSHGEPTFFRPPKRLVDIPKPYR